MLENCGQIEPQNDRRSLDQSLTQDAVNCLTDSRTRGGGELRVTALTIEGDPILMYFRTISSPTVDIYLDETRDRFGSGSWKHTTCQVPTLTAEALVACLNNV